MGRSGAVIKSRHAVTAFNTGAAPAMVRRILKHTAAAVCLLAMAACATAPNVDALIELHDQAVTLHRPAVYLNDEGAKPHGEINISDLQSSR
jgi:hypothetical protein